jgi:isoquinoline 1-oxidoreductase beta subunit
VRVIQLPYGYTENDKVAGNEYGAQGVAELAAPAATRRFLREAGATARRQLVAAAADEWKLPIESLRTANGHVLAPDGRKLSYGALARSAAAVPLPDGPVALKQAADLHIVGTPIRTADAADVVSGRTRFASDAYHLGALTAVLLRCPHPDGTLESLDDSAARKIPGVRDVVTISGPRADAPFTSALAAAVAVLADDTWAARRGRDSLQITWKPGPWAEQSSARLAAQADALLDAADNGIEVRRDGDFAQARKHARQVVTARYQTPFLAHATMETPAALVDIRQDGALLVASVTNPDGAARVVSDLTGLPRGAIDIRLPRVGGDFGRRLGNDHVAEAVLIARAAKKPVKLLWDRRDDLQHDRYAPFGVHALRATVDRRKRITGWSQRIAATPRNYRDAALADLPAWTGCIDPDAFPAGFVEHVDRRFHPIDCGLPRGEWRRLPDSFATFAEQSFLDEIAIETRQDAVELRLALLGAPRDEPKPAFDAARLAHVLRRCAERAEWGRKRSDGHGIGIACHASAGSHVAHAFEVSARDGELRIHRAICVVDRGRTVNPLGLRGRAAAATVDGISTALHLAITLKGGRVRQRDFYDYPLLRMGEAPREVEVEVIDSDDEPTATDGLIATVAPALANAIFAATTVRVRKLPIMPELMRML